MHLRLCFILFLIGPLFAKAQNPKFRALEAFSEIKVYDKLQVRLIQSDSNKIEVSGPYAEDLNVVNRDGLLKVKMDWEKAFDGEHTLVKIYYKQLELIDGNESAVITVQDTIIQDNIEIRAQEAAQIDAKLDVQEAIIKANSGSILSLSGKADHQEVKISTGGVYNAKSLQSAAAEVRVQAGGEARIYATEFAKLTVRAGGDIFVYGDPRNVEQTKFIAGDIKIMP